MGGAQQGWRERANRALLNVGPLDTRDPSLPWEMGLGADSPHQPQVRTWDLPQVQGGPKIGMKGVSHYIITWGRGTESEGGVGFSPRRNRNWPRT